MLSSSDIRPPSARQRAETTDAISMFESEGHGEPSAKPDRSENNVGSRSDDAILDVRQRLLAAETGSSISRSIQRRVDAAKFTIAEFAHNVSSGITSTIRNYLVQNPKLPVGAASVACVLIVALVVAFMVRGPATVANPSESSGAAVSTHVNEPAAPTQVSVSPAATAVNQPPVAPPAKAALPPAATTRPTAAATAARAVPRAQPRRDNVGAATAAPARRASTQVSAPVNNAAPLPAAAAVTAAPDRAQPPATLPSTSIPRFTENNREAGTIYSHENPDVRPPQAIEVDLPRPAVVGWATIKNAMEVVVGEDGSVERVKWLGPPQRMPDVMLLSRAKLWKFAPAVKDGDPVRYRLVLTWEVNP
jgi:hypothetical protein